MLGRLIHFFLTRPEIKRLCQALLKAYAHHH